MLAGSLITWLSLGLNTQVSRAELQRRVAGVLGRGGEADQRIVRRPASSLHLKLPLPVGPVNGHRHGRLRTARAVIVEGVLEDRVRGGVGQGLAGDQRAASPTIVSASRIVCRRAKS